MQHATSTKPTTVETGAPTVTGVAGVHDVSARTLAHSSLPKVSYADQFTLATTEKASPEQWARAMFGDVPSVGELMIWRVILGLRLAKGTSASTVAGWQIGDRGDDWIRLEATSWFLSANLIVDRSPGQVSLTTMVSYDRFPADILWTNLSKVHRRLSPGVLRDADSRIPTRTS